MRKTHLFVLFCVLSCAGWAIAQPQTYRKTLDQSAEVQGYPCAKGYAWFYQSGHLRNCTVAKEIAFGEATIPAGSWITLTEDGKPQIAQMSHDTNVAGVMCLGGGLLGSSTGPVVAFYPSGKVKECFLAADQLVQGVPCAQGGFVASISHVDPSLKLYESGKLKSCKLAADYGGMKKGDRFQQAP